MRTVFTLLLVVHGFIHFIGFAKAFDLSGIQEIKATVSRPMGILWLAAGLLFILTMILYVTRTQYWWMFALPAVLLSQLVILLAWQDAKFGTAANLVILAISLIAFQTRNFERKYLADVIQGVERTKTGKEEILTKEDIQDLPSAVQRYIEYTGALNKPKVRNVKITFDAEMRSRSMDWFTLTTEQYNFFDRPERLFFLKARFKGLPTAGYHLYKNGKSGMRIKLLSMIPVATADGEKMFEAETVTFFNDMCIFAPATLIDERITWEEIDSTRVRATFTNEGTTISAILHFNRQGQLVNFESNDRYDVNVMKKYTFSTPVKNYRPVKGFNLAGYGEAVWHYPEGEFVYGRYQLKDIKYNVGEYQNQPR